MHRAAGWQRALCARRGSGAAERTGRDLKEPFMPPTLNYPGVYIEEVPSGARAIAGVATSIAAFVGRTWRGTVGEPVAVFGLGDFEREFGGLWRNSSVSYAVKQFFTNGGSHALVVRVVNGTD